MHNNMLPILVSQLLDPCAAAGSADGARRLIRHPQRCDWFIECGPGYRYTRQCGPTLNFNWKKGACDYPQFAECSDLGLFNLLASYKF